MGAVLSSADCAPIAGARIEMWLTNPDGSYDDDHRATLFSGDDGRYRFESNIPHGYFGRPPHIHIRTTAEGFETLVTQHYPTRGQSSGEFDIVLVPIE
jgi:protocatechuate 3,4-dioxygenase beta subunit